MPPVSHVTLRLAGLGDMVILDPVHAGSEVCGIPDLQFGQTWGTRLTFGYGRPQQGLQGRLVQTSGWCSKQGHDRKRLL